MAEKKEHVINPQEVDEAFGTSLYTEEEIKGFVDGKPPADAVIVESIRGKIAFNPKRLEEHRGKVTEWLKLLPHQFRKNSGGGWSFLQACVQENGEQWTGLQLIVDELFCLGIGLGLAELQFPRKMWPALPGGMPYYIINIE